MTPKSFWPAGLVSSDEVMPETVLRDQAKQLEVATNGLLRGEVESGSQGNWMTTSFFIVAPRLDGYLYRLFKVRRKLPDPFNPLEIIIGSKDIRRVASREDFERQLVEIFSAPATLRVVQELMALSVDADRKSNETEADER